MARTVALFTTATPTSAQLETEFAANWQPLQVTYPAGTYLFIWVKAAVWPVTVDVYLRSALGDELDSQSPIWGRHPDGAAVVTTPAPSDGWAMLRYFIGTDVSGAVVGSSGAGTCQLSVSPS